MSKEDNGTIRQFDTGAIRDTAEGKLDYEGFFSPQVMKRFAQYMHLNRVQSDGSLRDSDNWQKGIPKPVYMKSMFRHFMEVWEGHREGREIESVLCALLFNVQGYLHEVLKEKTRKDQGAGLTLDRLRNGDFGPLYHGLLAPRNGSRNLGR